MWRLQIICLLISSQNHNNEQILGVFSARLEVIIMNVFMLFLLNFRPKRHQHRQLFLFIWLQ